MINNCEGCIHLHEDLQSDYKYTCSGPDYKHGSSSPTNEDGTHGIRCLHYQEKKPCEKVKEMLSGSNYFLNRLLEEKFGIIESYGLTTGVIKYIDRIMIRLVTARSIIETDLQNRGLK
jgi:hypothetical protein